MSRCRTIRARCPAKVNLDLRVLGRRPDGYHEIRTRFQAIDLEDVVEVEPSATLEIRCDAPGVPAGPDNLVARAAVALGRTVGRRPGGSFRIVKRIPVGAGLGGGSSDAAAAIVLLERLWGVSLERDARIDVAASVGSDVPFFLTGGTAFGTGRGDRVRPLRFLGEVPLLLGVPPFPASTAEVYRGWSARLTPPADGVSVPRLSGSGTGVPGHVDEDRNDLESVAFGRWPELERFRDALVAHGAATALLSGSGSTVFGRFGSRSERDRAAEAIGRLHPGWRMIRAVPVPHGVRVDPGDRRVGSRTDGGSPGPWRSRRSASSPSGKRS